MEGDGAMSYEFERFLKKASSAAAENRGHDAPAFRKKWRVAFGCKLFRMSALVSLKRAAGEYVRLIKASTPAGPIVLAERLGPPVDLYRSYRNAYSDKSQAQSAARKRGRAGKA